MMKKEDGIEIFKIYIFTFSFLSNTLLYITLILHKNFKTILIGKSLEKMKIKLWNNVNAKICFSLR